MRVVVIGASLGGLKALQAVLRALPGNFAVPLVIVQHRSKQSEEGYVTLLQEGAALRVVEAQDKDPLIGGHVYVAPSDYHVLVEPDGVALSTEGPVNHSRPSIDVLFESAAHVFGKEVVGVLLTGSSADGARGAAQVRAKGGFMIVQDPATAEAPVMPAAAVAAGGADMVLALDAIGPSLVELTQQGGA